MEKMATAYSAHQEVATLDGKAQSDFLKNNKS